MKTINEIRSEFDAIDDEIATLYMRRLDISREVAEAKRASGTPIANPAREREILARVAKRVGPGREDGAALLFNTLFGLSKALQRDILQGESDVTRAMAEAIAKTGDAFPSDAIVACQGSEGAYSQQAASRLFKFPTIFFFNTFDDVFSAVEKGMCQYGILPIENSLAGSVTAVYDQMVRHNFRIVRAARLPVGHVLLGRKGAKLGDIREVVSHTQALQQCSRFLAAHPDIRQTPSVNTAVAARTLAESGRADLAAIASRQCAEIYGLDILSDDIADVVANYTRFICISKNLEIYPDSRKISLMMSLPHKPGSLSGILAKFSAIGVNLTKLESRPVPGRDFEFRFTFEFEAEPHNERAGRLISELSQDPEIEHFTFLGAYAEI